MKIVGIRRLRQKGREGDVIIAIVNYLSIRKALERLASANFRFSRRLILPRAEDLSPRRNTTLRSCLTLVPCYDVILEAVDPRKIDPNEEQIERKEKGKL